jgi:hypothetical protein
VASRFPPRHLRLIVNLGVALETLRKLFRRKRALTIEVTRPERAPDELERERDLLEQVAAGIALNKTPGR